MLTAHENHLGSFQSLDPDLTLDNRMTILGQAVLEVSRAARLGTSLLVHLRWWVFFHLNVLSELKLANLEVGKCLIHGPSWSTFVLDLSFAFHFCLRS